MLKEATLRAFSVCPAPISLAISVPPPAPAILEKAMQTLKIGKMSAAPATI